MSHIPDLSSIDRRPNNIRYALATGNMRLDTALQICEEEIHPSSQVLAGELSLVKARKEGPLGHAFIDNARDHFVRVRDLAKQQGQLAHAAFSAAHVAQVENYRSLFCNQELPDPQTATTSFEATIAELSPIAKLLPDRIVADTSGHGMMMKMSVLSLMQRLLLAQGGSAILASGYAAWYTGQSRPYDIALPSKRDPSKPGQKIKVVSRAGNVPSWGKEHARDSIVIPARELLRLSPQEPFTSKTIIRECAQELSTDTPRETRLAATHRLNIRQQSFVNYLSRHLVQ